MKKLFILVFLFLSEIIVCQTVYKHIPTTLKEMYGEQGFSIQNGKIGTGFTEGVWSQKSNMPFPRYYGASVMYTKNDTSWLYVIGGDTTGGGVATASCLRYNVLTDTWQYIAPLPEPLRTNTAAVAGDKIYTMGGFNAPYPSPAVKSFYVYDILSDTWSQLPDLPVALFFAGAVSYEDSLIYIIGGVENTTTALTDLWSARVRLYNINNQTFRDADKMPQATAGFAFAITGNKLFVSGGLKSENELLNFSAIGTINLSNRSHIDWTLRANYPLSVYAHYAAVFPNNKIYLGGGSTSTGFDPVNNAYEYDIDGDMYNAEINLPVAGMAYHSGVSFTGGGFSANAVVKLVIAGGVITGPALTNQTWVFEDSVEVSGINKFDGSLPKDFYLLQNYPNPFNPTTNIRFGVSNTGYVSLKIFDILGREINTLVSEDLKPGNYTAVWDAKNQSNGIYFYKLQTERFSVTKKMILLK